MYIFEMKIDWKSYAWNTQTKYNCHVRPILLSLIFGRFFNCIVWVCWLEFPPEIIQHQILSSLTCIFRLGGGGLIQNHVNKYKWVFTVLQHKHSCKCFVDWEESVLRSRRLWKGPKNWFIRLKMSKRSCNMILL